MKPTHLALFAMVGLLLVVGAQISTAAPLSVLGGLTRETSLQPGGRTEGRITLRNNTRQPQHVKVYQTDYGFWADGRNDYGDKGSSPRSNADWVIHAPSQTIVAPGATESIYYTIQVPPRDDLRGTYWSMLMVEPISRATLEPDRTQEGQAVIGIQTVLRYGIQIVTHIGSTGERELEFADRQLIVAGGKRTLQLDVANVGERWLVPLVWAELYDPQGTPFGRLDAGRLRIYPGCSARYRIDLSPVPAGRYKAVVVADNGDEYVFGAQYDVDLRGEDR